MKKTPSNSPFKRGGLKASALPSFEGEGNTALLRIPDTKACGLSRTPQSGVGGGPGSQLLLAVCLCTFGCALLVAGIALPPAGEIHSSVLVAFGEILTFSGSIVGIDYHYKYQG